MNLSSFPEKRFYQALTAMSLAAMTLVVFFPLLVNLLPQTDSLIPPSGHSLVHTHGHAFIDARRFFGIPNCLDVVSNIPFFFAGAWGLVVLGRRTLQGASERHTYRAAQIFFAGLIFTCFGSGFYHWAPGDFGLMMDRMGMAVAFAGVISLAAGSRLGDSAAHKATLVLLVLGCLAAAAAYGKQNVLPWAVVQFGGMALIVWLAMLPKREGLALNLWALIAWYALAKIFEAQDTAVFELTGGIISGHSMKHLAACLAAWPVIAACAKS